MLNALFLKKLTNRYIWKRIFYERLTEPLHLNLLSVFVAIFGGLRSKVDFDLVLRQQHAYALLTVADQAKSLGFAKVTVCEFGVAAGTGLLNIQELAERVTRLTGIEFDIYGFDTGQGMPAPKSVKDHPELYQAGDFPMNFEALSRRLTNNCHLILGPLEDSMNAFIVKEFSRAPIGFLSVDVDYYSSTVDALKILGMNPANYLPRVMIYLDDVEDPSHNTYCGEQAAIREHTERHPARPIEKPQFLRGYRIFKNARWIDHIYQCHVLDHASRNMLDRNGPKVILANPYLR